MTEPLADLRRRSIQVHVPAATPSPAGPVWLFPPPGTTQAIKVPSQELDREREQLHLKTGVLAEWPSTAICSNDLLASVLYSSGIVASKAGKLSPIPVLMVAVVLYFFRFIYEEVVSAIPLNGGSYNVLLNTTSKRTASFGAALGIISYLATGVVSGATAVNYLRSILDVPLVGTTIALLAAFAVLSLFGITDSSRVALVIFLHHLVVLVVLCVASIVYVVQHTEVIQANMESEFPRIDFAGTFIDSNVPTAIFFGFGAAMLGITGFETSAQFVEEQKPGVFRKTLRNMWVMVSIFNTVVTFLTVAALPMDAIYAASDFVVAKLAEVVLGHWFKVWIVVDAFIVLSGSVLTSYVGILGLVRRLASDRVLPAFLLTQNKWRGTNHYIIVLFFLVASSLILILDADTAMMGGVYTYAFLGLMALFSFGCMVLKTKRAEIPRDTHAPWWSCILGFLCVVVGIFANLLGDPKVLMFFAFYLIAVVGVMMVMLERVAVLQLVLNVMKTVLPSRRGRGGSGTDKQQPSAPPHEASFLPLSSGHEFDAFCETPTPYEQQRTDLYQTLHTGARGGRTLAKAILSVNETPMIFLCKHPDMKILHKAIMYVRKNEQTQQLRIVHVASTTSTKPDGGENGDTSDVLREFVNVVALFDHIFPKIRIDFVHVDADFEPAVVQWLSVSLHTPINLMFITQPGDSAVHSVAKLGVRVITA